MGDADIALPWGRRVGLRRKFINWGTNIVAAFAHIERALGKIFGRPRTPVATENSIRPEMSPELANRVIILRHPLASVGIQGLLVLEVAVQRWPAGSPQGGPQVHS